MSELDYVKEIADSFIKSRENDIKNLKSDEIFTISIDDFPILREVLENVKENFRKTVKQSLIKSYIRLNFDDDDVGEIEKTINDYRKMELDIHIPTNITVGEINAEDHERKIITFDCQVFSIGKEQTDTKKLLLKCYECDEEYELGIVSSIGAKCPKCKDSLVEIGNAQTETIRNVFIKELSDQSFDIDRTLTAKVHGEQANQVKFNDRVRITGVFKSIPIKKRKKDEFVIINKVIIDVINIENIEKEKTSLPSTEKIEEYKNLARQGKLRDLLIRSFAYNIKGNNDQKMAVLLAMVGGTKTKSRRGRINILIVGPPGTGKTATSKFMKEVSHKGCLTDITGSSDLGLFFGKIDTPDGGQGLSAGPLVKYSGGHVFIDEFEKGAERIYKMILKTMEEGEISRSITGFGEITAQADTTIIACENPKFGAWNDKLSIMENLGLDEYVISRFDIIFRLYDTPDAERDYEIDKFIMDDSTEDRPEDVLSENELNEFLNYSRAIKPKMSEESIHKLSLFFSSRSKYLKEGSLPIDRRQIVVLKRKATAFAKLDLQEIITEKYANEAIEFFKKELESFNMTIEEAGNFGEGGLTKWMKGKSKEEAFRVIFHEVEGKEEEGLVFEDVLINEMVKYDKWKTREDAVNYIERSHNRGLLAQKANGSLRIV